ncbi:MAG TPA: UvrB/UvrC motif-containing protein [Candidatus Saccharimonadales bacterium]|jgi:excinuclease ABC subunit C|nr:UvrB/UvrC motif-containing protein [Candidatus Saccharimonadales bacterium]
MTNLLENLPKQQIVPKIYQKLPESPGIYVFFKDGFPIYIGKAINLKRRVSSYFDLNLETKTARMISEADELSVIKVESELEALLLEAKLIRLYMPKYNIISKDDKHPLYIQITKEKYPRIITARKIAENQKNLAFYGPFPFSNNVRSVLKMIRRIFPFSDHNLGTRPCLYSHIGLCNPCPSEINQITDYGLKIMETKKYRLNIRRIKSILDGHVDKVKTNLEKEMENASKNQDYELAGQIRDRIEKIEYITRPQMPTEFYMQNPNLYEDQRKFEIGEFSELIKNYKRSLPSNGKFKINNLSRIECYDVAHLAGTNATASMVTFINGEADKSFYRHFRIRQEKGNSDIDSMREIVARRIKHLEDWGKPDLIIVDGGVAQVNAFTCVLQANKVMIPVVGIAKHPDRLIINDQKIKLEGKVLNLVSRIRDEAHRFARVYHHELVSRSLVN